jgi:hypothetical protein
MQLISDEIHAPLPRAAESSAGIPGSYLYETHLHTAQVSGCASVPGQDYIKYYKDAGYTGIFVTDHFNGGECVVDRNLPW